MKTASSLALVAAGLVILPAARADITYQNENVAPATAHEIFNNSFGSETEDCWVANAFQVAAGGTQITQILFRNGNALTARSVTVTLYTGSSLTNPQAGAGLVRLPLTTTTVTITSAADTMNTITLANPATLAVGQIFYAAVLMPGVPGSLFPFSSDAMSTPAVTPLGRSFFDVGPMTGPNQGGAYNLDVTTRATVMGGSHPVVDGAQSPGNVVVRAVGIPAPGGVALLGLAVMGGARRRRTARA